jgi:outer membrane protein assembly factor BamB
MPSRRVITAAVTATVSLLWGIVPLALQPRQSGAKTSTTTATSTTTTTAAYADAVTFGENAARDNYAGPKDLPSTLQLSWSKQFPQRVSYAIIAGGRVFVTVSRATPPSTTSPEVYAFDGASGALIWGPYVVPDLNSDFASLAYDAGRLFVVSQRGFAAALQPATGAQIWSRNVGFGGGSDMAEPPIAFGGHLYDATTTAGVGAWSINESNGVQDLNQ